MIASIIKKRMKKTKWFLGTGIVMAMLVIASVFTKKPAQATAAETAGEDYKLEQIGTAEYSSFEGGYASGVEILKNASNDTYTVITTEGKIATLDNSVTKYADIKVLSGYSYSSQSKNMDVVRAFNQAGKFMFVTPTGKPYGGMTDYHEDVRFTDNLAAGDFAGSYYTVDGNDYVVYDKNGNKVTAYSIDNATAVSKVVRYANCTAFALSTKTSSGSVSKLISVDQAGTVKEVLSGYYFSTINELVVCGYASDKTGPIYLNGNFEEITFEEAGKLQASVPNYEYYGYGSISVSSSQALEGGYVPTYMGYQSAKFKVIQGRNTSGEIAYFSPSGKKLADGNIDFLASVDMAVKKTTKTDGTAVYTLYKLLKSGETLNVEYYVEPTETPDDIVTEITIQEAKADDTKVSVNVGIGVKPDVPVYFIFSMVDTDNKKETVEVKAEKNVLPVGAWMDFSRIKTGETYENAQKVIGTVANKATVYEIDVYNSENVKVQPNGNIQFTLEVPEGYVSEKVSVYRIETDGTYTKMESNIVDGKVVFVTNHFSTYVITEDKDTSDTSDTDVTTGDRSPVVFYMIAALGALSLLAVLSRKKIVK